MGDHDSSSYRREVGALGDAIDEMLLVRAAAKIGERQDNDGEARRAGFFGAGVGADFVSAGAPISSEKDPDRIGDVLEFFRAEIAGCEFKPPFTWR